ncbi:DUF924 domain-containing protein [Alteromonas sp. ASW11-19]|uniref:DUF924 domain-containing protein n=1 Tax=Alteromonas salexigens TaxID=2982530 RepID=A0ABT2VKR4_9ALTE|nr:DUF924 family protein [Alteromonas salexigens]MCU7553878.1 DUF924 domain-containing protein [Alteromonas salexigens]
MNEETHVAMEEASEVLSFWFEELDEQDWFAHHETIDKMIASRFGNLLRSAARCELWPWRATPHGRLAEIIVLDQFSRNVYRNTAQAFAQDTMALCLAQEAVSANADKAMTARERAFLYMPFMHSESLAVHEVAMELFAAEGLEKHLRYEQEHRNVLVKFGRYPNRNEALGRTPTPAESAWLAEQSG